jgi:RimJ/RimL family protein N-acetyltransferase
LKLTFEALRSDHIPILCRWLNAGPVLQWYSHGRPKSIVQVAHHYERSRPTRHFIARIDGRPAGMLQTYRIDAYPDYFAQTGAEPGWAGLDYLIGEAEFRGRGLAPGMIERFLDEVVFAEPSVTACLSGPDPANEASVRTLRRAGFETLRTIETGPEEKELLMLKKRPPADV